jgi:ABC-type uncharacterized transport system substrate-binding protein
MAKKVLAVAIGDPNNSSLIKTAADANSDKVRPYVRGLVSWLATQAVPPKAKNLTKFQIGTAKDYVIDYRECRDSNNDADLDALFNTYGGSADLIFCMSTTVARRAAHYTTTKPIVAIVSDPKRETTFGPNVCGVSAMRSQNTGDCCEEFRESLPDLTRIYFLHKAGYTPSEDAKYWLPNDPLNVSVPIALADNIATTISNLAQAPSGETYGILVLPADRFFGERANLITAATSKGFPTYWSVTDFVGAGGAFGGYGVPQAVSGRFMAERVANIWTNTAIPSPPFVPIRKKHIESKLSLAVAKALKLKLAHAKSIKKKPRKPKKR